MYDFNKLTEFISDLNDIYNESYPEAIIKLRQYISYLVWNTYIDNETKNISINVLEFIESIFENRVNLFLDFIIKLNETKYEVNSFDKIEQVIKEKLEYKGYLLFYKE